MFPKKTSSIIQTTFEIGGKDFLRSVSENNPSNAVVFEDDGETGYFYALDLSCAEKQIQDALHIYKITPHQNKRFELCITWSKDGTKVALLMDGLVHGVFDFVAKAGFCRTGFPYEGQNGWSKNGHQWGKLSIEPFW
jgi:hypothetical protein